MPDEFYTINEVASLLKLTPQTIRGWLKDGKLQSYRFGRSHRIRCDEVDRLIAASSTPHVQLDVIPSGVIPFMGDADNETR